MKRATDWDIAVTVAFAAEQSFAAAQLLTSDKITLLEALRLSYAKHIATLVGNAHFLPISITAELCRLQAAYVQAEERGISREDAFRMASELMATLRQLAPL